MRPKKARRKIVAYVESYDDVFFWRTLLNEFENDRRYFQVMLPSSTSLAKGKKSVLMNILGESLGQNMIACVDSDYDYLLQGATNTSRMINQNRFVFQTYTYAIENYQCYASALHEVCVMSTLNDREIIDLEEFMRMYSRIAYPLFIWSIWFYRKHRPGVFSLLARSGVGTDAETCAAEVAPPGARIFQIRPRNRVSAERAAQSGRHAGQYLSVHPGASHHGQCGAEGADSALCRAAPRTRVGNPGAGRARHSVPERTDVLSTQPERCGVHDSQAYLL